MGELVNLNRYRKLRDRQDRERQAAENRTRFGRSKGERVAEDTRRRKDQADLDAKKLEPSPTDE
jgi:hypothetical protein